MSIFPKVADLYYTDNDQAMIQRMRKVYNESITINQSYWTEADIDTRFLAGDQEIWRQIYGALPLPRRRQFNFNRIRRIINMISGYQRRNRKSIICISQDGANEETASQFTQLLMWAHNRINMGQLISDAFERAITTGMCLISSWIDYRNDPINGDICCDVMPYNSFLIDPWFRKQDLSDCQYIWTRKYLSKAEVKSLLPDREGEINNMQPETGQDDKFIFLPENYNTNRRTLLGYDEFWYRDYREQELLIDTQNGQTLEWKGKKENLEEFLSFAKGRVKLIKQKKSTVKLAIAVNNKVMYNGPNPYSTDSFPFTAFLAYYQPELPYYPLRIQGVIRSLRDAQYLYNRRKIIELSMLEARATSSLKVMEGTLVDPNDAFLTDAGRTYFVKRDAPMGLDGIQPMPNPDVPASMIQLSGLLGEEINQISGVSEELLGMADDDKAGILSMLRQGASLTTLQKLFDQLDFSMKCLGLQHTEMIQNNFEIGKVESILHKPVSPQFENKFFSKYDCQIQEGTDTTNQKQLILLQLLKLREIGIPVPTEVLLENITVQNKKELVQAIKQQESGQAQAQQQQEQLQLQSMSIANNSAEAYAKAQESLAAERMNKVQLDAALSAERLSKAEEDRDSATLARIKAAKELSNIDIAQLQNLLKILQTLQKEPENPQQAV